VQIAVLGMGRMGRALGSRLLDTGHDVTVWNRSEGRAAELVDRGATEVRDPAEAVTGVDVVCTSLADDGAVRAVLAPGGAPLDTGSTPVVEMSTIAPATARELGGLYGGTFVASPILGAPQAVAAGEAALAVAGPDDVVDALAPLWAAVTDKLRRIGTDPGLAQVVKLCNNYLLMSGIATLAEVVATGQAGGLSDEELVELLGQLPTVAPALRNRVDDIVRGPHEGWFSTELGAKDVRLFSEEAAANGVSLPLADAVRERYQAAAGAGYGDADLGAVVELLRTQ
jgi:3-hydroxyisobutyrate dehydrogenase-like beta-hydroxyacid dehydrogenase